MRDTDELHIPSGEGQSADCPMARTAAGHYLRQIAITKRRQGSCPEMTARRRQRTILITTLWKR